MLYPAFVELGNDKEAYSVVLPDFDGCFTATDNEDELPKSVQEAVELHFEGEDFDLPPPSKLETLKASDDYNYDGVWMFFNIDTAKLSTKAKRINITFPRSLLSRLDNQAKELHVSRSGLLQSLVEKNLP
jgi:predicted RNase H-like HicB family nuclease